MSDSPGVLLKTCFILKMNEIQHTDLVSWSSSQLDMAGWNWFSISIFSSSVSSFISGFRLFGMLSILFWNKICFKFMLVFKAEELKKNKTSKSLNQQRQLIKFENNKFKDFACGISGWNDFNILLVSYQNWKTYRTDPYLFFLLPCYSIWFIWSICFCHGMQNWSHLSLQRSRSFIVIITSRKYEKKD